VVVEILNISVTGTTETARPIQDSKSDSSDTAREWNEGEVSSGFYISVFPREEVIDVNSDGNELDDSEEGVSGDEK